MFFALILGTLFEVYFLNRESAITHPDWSVNLRACPKPVDHECPSLVKIPSGSKVVLLDETAQYTQADGYRATWQKVEYEKRKGWVNRSLLYFE